MANRTEYEMLFRLNAQMNGGFSGTVSKAQAEFTRLGKEVQSLQSLQRDISSYQKQQSAVEATRAKLESLQKQHDLLQREIKETEGSTTGLEREDVKLEQRIQDTQAALERQQQKLSTTGAKLRDAGVDTANLAQKDRELTAQIRELEAEQDRAANGAFTFGERTTAAFGAIQEAIAAAGIAVALKEIYDSYMECVSIAADFQETMSTVEALSGANAEDMAALTAEAKELGATTKFTAKESAEAMTYMAMAGWDAQQMLSGMDGVLQLAAASGEDLALVSDIVTDNLTAFGLTAADTAHFSDVLAAAATSSNTSVSIMGETFKQSAAVAGALGYSVEDVAVAVGLMANAGVKGSIAGTALKNTFNGLLEGATLTSDAFGEYEFTALKADGTMKSFSETIDELRGCFEQMTEAERVNNAMTLAGQRGYNGLLAVLNATDADYAKLTNSITNCSGAASRMAAIKLDNLNGQVTLMNSAWDALKTTIGEEFNPELQALAEIATDVLTSVNGFVQEHPALVKGVMTFVGAMGLATAGMTAYAAITKIVAALNVAALFTGPAGAVLAAVGAVAALTAGIVALNEAAGDSVPSLKELTEAARDAQEEMDEAGGTLRQTGEQTLSTVQVVETYIAKLEELGEGTEASDEHSRTYLNTLALLCDAVPELAEYIDLETGAIEGGTEALREHTEAWKQDAEEQAYRAYMNTLYEKYNDIMTNVAENSMKLAEAQNRLEKAQMNEKAARTRLNELDARWLELTEEEKDELYRLEEALVGYTNEIDKAQGEIGIYTMAVEEGNAALAEADSVINDAADAYNRLTGATEDQTGADAEAARQTAELNDRIGSTMERVQTLTEAYEEAYSAAYDSISGQYALWDKAAEVAATSAGTINDALESQIAYWQDYNANLASLTDRAADIEGLSELIASFADGSAESVNAIAGMAGASDEDLRAMVQNWRDLKREQDAASDGIAEMTSGFSAAMDGLQDELSADIEAMDLSVEAAASGKATVQGYIDGALGMLPQAQAAYDRLGRAAKRAMAIGDAGDAETPVMFMRAYASGTANAAPGAALVGEDGPEVIYFNGGERVLNAAQTAAVQSRAESAALALSGRSGHPVSVNFQISGNATRETVQDLRAFGDEIVAKVLAAIDDADEDNRRRAY